MSVNIKYKNNSIATLTDTGTKTLKTSGKYCEADIIVENTNDGGGGGNVATGTFTPVDIDSDVTVEHGLGVVPTTIMAVPMPTGAADKTVPISFYIAKKDVGGIKISGNGSDGKDFESLYYRALNASTIAQQWGDSTEVYYGVGLVQAVDAQKFVAKRGFGARTILWFAAV